MTDPGCLTTSNLDRMDPTHESPIPLQEVACSVTDSVSHVSFVSASPKLPTMLLNNRSDVGLTETPPRPAVINMNHDSYEYGYDSDGMQAPWLENGIFEIELGDYIEEELPCDNPANSGADEGPVRTDEQTALPTDLTKLTVNKLKDELKQRNLATSGKKEVLVERLKKAIDENAPIVTDEAVGNVERVGQEFDVDSFWKYIEADGEYITEADDGFRAPTAPRGEVGTLKKRNYTEMFDRDVWMGETELPVLDKLGRPKYSATGHDNLEWRKVNCDETVPKLSFLMENDLTRNSHPAEWFESVLPNRSKRYGDKSSFTVEKFWKWTNLRATLEGAGDTIYKGEWQPFTLEELMKHIGK